MAEKKQQGATTDLSEIRKRIDEVDQKIQSLINERARFAQQVGVSKGDHGSAVDYYRPEREAEVLRRIQDRNDGPLRDEEMLRLFREIMSACLAQQEPLKIGSTASPSSCRQASSARRRPAGNAMAPRLRRATGPRERPGLYHVRDRRVPQA